MARSGKESREDLPGLALDFVTDRALSPMSPPLQEAAQALCSTVLLRVVQQFQAPHGRLPDGFVGVVLCRRQRRFRLHCIRADPS